MSEQKQRQRVLFTGMGSSDPVRGYRDGGMLHIMRYYRPEKVYIFLTGEMEEMDRRDHRIHTTMEFLRDNWGGYAPEVIPVVAEIQDPSELDAVDGPMEQTMRRIQQENPDAVILLNLSSGTPQMKFVLNLLAISGQYRTLGIQVKNPEAKSGTAERTNQKNLPIDIILETNEDESDPINRCVEPEMLSARRKLQLEQVLTLVDRRDYAAAAVIKGALPTELMQLVRHLAARQQLRDQEARELAKRLKLPFSLYPIRNGTGSSWDYREVSEYYLVLKNLQHTGQLTYFTLRLNPLVIRLQRGLVSRFLGFPLKDILERRDGREQFSATLLRGRDPELGRRLDESFGPGNSARDGDLNITLLNRLLGLLPGVPETYLTFLKQCERLNQGKRNTAAHDLQTVTEQQIIDACGLGSWGILRGLEQLIVFLYPQCDPALFDIYQRCGQYIRDNA